MFLSRHNFVAIAFFWVSAMLLGGCGGSPSGSTASAPHVKVELLHSATTDKTFVGLRFDLEPEWHIYWRNPGDTGIAPTFMWKTANALIGKQLWPTPQIFELAGLINYGYAGSVLLPFEVKARDPKRPIAVEVKASWLVCKEECIPGAAVLRKIIEPSNQTQLSEDFSRTLASVPEQLPNSSFEAELQSRELVLRLNSVATRSFPDDAIFLPNDRNVIEYGAEQIRHVSGSTLEVRAPASPALKTPPPPIRGIFLSRKGWDGSGTVKAIQVETAPEPLNIGADVSLEEEPSGLGTLFVFAVIGGLLLNIMPCVFPVLAIKILGFIELGNNSRLKALQHSFAFALGVILSFLALGAALAALRSSGAQLGWGFQLQNATFVILMAFLFLAMGFALLLDVELGTTLQNVSGSVKTSNNLFGSFASGVLATAVASPCTAPYMGSALAATAVLPVAQSLLVFLGLGVGMSLPYVIFTGSPRLMHLLPRPGGWMVTFKEIMSFPLLASAVWLIGVAGQQFGISDAQMALLNGLGFGSVTLLGSLWLFRNTRRSNRRTTRVLGRLVAVALAALALRFAIPDGDAISRARTVDSAGGTVDSYGLSWVRYSDVELERALAAGREVYIDFTAAWCITCQVNKKVVLSSDKVRALFHERKVVLMRGDWTSQDPEITEALARYGRNGVPVNVVYRSDSRNPTVLPSVLTPGIVLAAFE